MGCVYFVRHGQTVWNVENKICGATDIELTEMGHQQAIETGEKILAEGIKADEILYSPLVRAAETARHISEITGIPARVEPRLKEQNFGKWEATPRNGKEFQKAKEELTICIKIRYKLINKLVLKVHLNLTHCATVLRSLAIGGVCEIY